MVDARRIANHFRGGGAGGGGGDVVERGGGGSAAALLHAAMASCGGGVGEAWGAGCSPAYGSGNSGGVMASQEFGERGGVGFGGGGVGGGGVGGLGGAKFDIGGGGLSGGGTGGAWRGGIGACAGGGGFGSSCVGGCVGGGCTGPSAGGCSNVAVAGVAGSDAIGSALGAITGSVAQLPPQISAQLDSVRDRVGGAVAKLQRQTEADKRMAERRFQHVEKQLQAVASRADSGEWREKWTELTGTLNGLIDESQALARRMDSLDERLWTRANGAEEVARQGARELTQQLQSLERHSRLSEAAMEEAQRRQATKTRRIEHLMEDIGWRLAKIEEDASSHATPPIDPQLIERRMEQADRRHQELRQELVTALSSAASRLEELDGQVAALAGASAVADVGSGSRHRRGRTPASGGMPLSHVDEDVSGSGFERWDVLDNLEENIAGLDRKLGGQIEELAGIVASIRVKVDAHQQRHTGFAERLETVHLPAIEELRTKIEEERARDLREIDGKLAHLGQKVDLAKEAFSTDQITDNVDDLAHRLVEAESILSAQRRDMGDVRDELARVASAPPRSSEMGADYDRTGSRAEHDRAALRAVQEQLKTVAGQLETFDELSNGLADLCDRVAILEEGCSVGATGASRGNSTGDRGPAVHMLAATSADSGRKMRTDTGANANSKARSVAVGSCGAQLSKNIFTPESGVVTQGFPATTSVQNHGARGLRGAREEVPRSSFNHDQRRASPLAGSCGSLSGASGSGGTSLLPARQRGPGTSNSVQGCKGGNLDLLQHSPGTSGFLASFGGGTLESGNRFFGDSHLESPAEVVQAEAESFIPLEPTVSPCGDHGEVGASGRNGIGIGGSVRGDSPSGSAAISTPTAAAVTAQSVTRSTGRSVERSSDIRASVSTTNSGLPSASLVRPRSRPPSELSGLANNAVGSSNPTSARLLRSGGSSPVDSGDVEDHHAEGNDNATDEMMAPPRERVGGRPLGVDGRISLSRSGSRQDPSPRSGTLSPHDPSPRSGSVSQREPSLRSGSQSHREQFSRTDSRQESLSRFDSRLDDDSRHGARSSRDASSRSRSKSPASQRSQDSDRSDFYDPREIGRKDDSRSDCHESFEESLPPTP
eukprot:TRINITY_DN48421_c0_g1_i1.p1 TRINITY_DN48421_c0_g1~~TRINITY_DN48421_c0_g1_i1.p1  ORF type:complete len:1115 (+),score=199.41 TRINITY_DN48421_c0_g1_i1:63-3407(+)